MAPFCCRSVIPSTFIHLIDLLPKNTTQNALALPLSSTPILTSFLSFISNPSIFPPPPEKYTNVYFTIIQITKRITKSVPMGFNVALSTKVVTQTEEVRYYSTSERSSESTILHPKQKVFGKVWGEIVRDKALPCIQESFMPGSEWKKLPGEENFWCANHGCWYELKAWVRDV